LRHASPGTSPRRLATTVFSRSISEGTSGAASTGIFASRFGVSRPRDVAFAAAGTTSAYSGHVVSLEGNRVETLLKNAAGARADITLDLQLDRSTNAISGSVLGRTSA
jgi:hypothetical protein